MAKKRKRSQSPNREESPRPGGAAQDVRDALSEGAPPIDTSRRRRPGVTARRAANAETEVSVVKTTFDAFCTDEAKVLPWERLLRGMNQSVLEAYVLANAHVLRLCHLGRPIEALTQTFYSRCLSAVAGRGVRGSDDFAESVAMYNLWRSPDAARANPARGWQDNAALQMATATKTSVTHNFFRRSNKQLKRCYDINGREAYAMLTDILCDEYDGDDMEVRAWRERIPRTQNGRLDAQAHLLLPLTFDFLADIEEWTRRYRDTPGFKMLRAFTLLPTKSGFRCSHFAVGNRGLRELLKRAGADVPPEAQWTALADAWWRRLFHVGSFETANRRFAGQIQTDGKAVSVLLRKPKREATAAPMLNKKDYDVAWGLDPGRRDMFVATNQDGETVRCSTREFYEHAHYTKSNQKIAVWQARRGDVLEAIRGMPTKKTASLVAFETYIRYMTSHMDLLLEFKMEKPFRKLAFRRFVMRQKKLRALCLLVVAQAGRRTVVGFGDWSNADAGGVIKRCPVGPVKKFEHELKKLCRVVPIDEYKTSKLHSVCHGELRHQYSKRLCRGGEEQTAKVYSVLHCRSNGCPGTTVNRDVNASRNILMLLEECALRGRPRLRLFARD